MLEFDGACWFQCLPAESVVLKKFPVDSVSQLPAVINTRKGRQALRCASGEKQLRHAEEGGWNKQLAGSPSILSCGFILPQLPLKLKTKYKSMFCWNLRTTKTANIKYSLRNQYIRFNLQKLQLNGPNGLLKVFGIFHLLLRQLPLRECEIDWEIF